MPGLRRLVGVVVANLGEVVSLRDITTAVLDDGWMDGWMESLFSTWRHICSPGKAIFCRRRPKQMDNKSASGHCDWPTAAVV